MGNSESARYGDGRSAHDPFLALSPLLHGKRAEVLERAHAALATGRLTAPSKAQLARLQDRPGAPPGAPRPRMPPRRLLEDPDLRRRWERVARSLSTDPAEIAILAGPRARKEPATEAAVRRKVLVVNALETALAREINRILTRTGRRLGASHRSVLRTHLVAAVAETDPQALPDARTPRDWVRELRAWSRSPPARRLIEEATASALRIRGPGRASAGFPAGSIAHRLDTFLPNPPMRAATEPECT